VTKRTALLQIESLHFVAQCLAISIAALNKTQILCFVVLAVSRRDSVAVFCSTMTSQTKGNYVSKFTALKCIFGFPVYRKVVHY